MAARQPWDYHRDVNEHVIPNSCESKRTMGSRAARPSGTTARPLRSASDSKQYRSNTSTPRSTATPSCSQPVTSTPPSAVCGPSRILAQPALCASASTTSRLNASQATLYAALFGEPPPGWASNGDARAPGIDAHGDGAPPSAMGTGDDDGGQAKQIERAVRKAMRGAAVERQQAVDTALAAARQKHEDEVRRILARLDDEKDVAASEAAARVADEAAREREDLRRQAGKDRAAAVSRAVDAAEKAKDVEWRKVLAAQLTEAEAKLESVTRDKEAAIRRINRSKDMAVAEAIKSAREKMKQVEAAAERAAEAERERMAASERAARRQASKKVELINERTWAEAEQLREQAVAATRAEMGREHRQALEALKGAHEQEKMELRAEIAERERAANERADERLANTEQRFATLRMEMEDTQRAALEALKVNGVPHPFHESAHPAQPCAPRDRALIAPCCTLGMVCRRRSTPRTYRPRERRSERQ